MEVLTDGWMAAGGLTDLRELAKTFTVTPHGCLCRWPALGDGSRVPYPARRDHRRCRCTVLQRTSGRHRDTRHRHRAPVSARTVADKPARRRVSSTSRGRSTRRANRGGGWPTARRRGGAPQCGNRGVRSRRLAVSHGNPELSRAVDSRRVRAAEYGAQSRFSWPQAPQPQIVQRITRSIAHMHCNRLLGIDPARERAVLRLAADALAVSLVEPPATGWQGRSSDHR